MKSAYELAMERLQGTAPTPKLTQEQKEQLAEIDNLYRSKIAERETTAHSLMQSAKLANQRQELEQLQHNLARDLQTLREEWESKKEKLRKSWGI